MLLWPGHGKVRQWFTAAAELKTQALATPTALAQP